MQAGAGGGHWPAGRLGGSSWASGHTRPADAGERLSLARPLSPERQLPSFLGGAVSGACACCLPAARRPCTRDPLSLRRSSATCPSRPRRPRPENAGRCSTAQPSVPCPPPPPTTTRPSCVPWAPGRCSPTACAAWPPHPVTPRGPRQRRRSSCRAVAGAQLTGLRDPQRGSLGGMSSSAAWGPEKGWEGFSEEEALGLGVEGGRTPGSRGGGSRGSGWRPVARAEETTSGQGVRPGSWAVGQGPVVPSVTPQDHFLMDCMLFEFHKYRADQLERERLCPGSG